MNTASYRNWIVLLFIDSHTKTPPVPKIFPSIFVFYFESPEATGGYGPPCSSSSDQGFTYISAVWRHSKSFGKLVDKKENKEKKK